MNLSNAWTTGCLIFCFIIVINGHLLLEVPIETTPWMVNIHTYNLSDGIQRLHCVGVLTEPTKVMTSSQCLSTLPQNFHMVLYSGYEGTYVSHNTQKFLPFGIGLTPPNNQIILISITPPMHQTLNVDYIKVCTELNCLFDGPDYYGYQYGYRPVRGVFYRLLYLTQYDFSNSSALCQEIENGHNKFCTYHDCTSEFGNVNIGGEVLTKVSNGQAYLMGLWDCDVCDKNIRVFHKIEQDAGSRRLYRL